MTLGQVATFASSESGNVYLKVCDRFGLDPGAVLEDDFLAYQLRIGLLVAHGEAKAPPEDPHTAFEVTRLAGAQIRRQAGMS